MWCVTPCAIGIDLVLDCVGASYAAQNLAVLKPADGRWVLYGTMGGAECEKVLCSLSAIRCGSAQSYPLFCLRWQFPLGAILRKRVSLLGTTLRNRSVAYKAALIKVSAHSTSALSVRAPRLFAYCLL